MERSAVRAAVEVGRTFDVESHEPALVHETNNSVVWLWPHPVIAKVCTRRDNDENLVREFDVARALHVVGAPVAEPLPGSTPRHDQGTGHVVTLWKRLERDPRNPPLGRQVGETLLAVHRGLSQCDLGLPDFMVGVMKARDALFDDSRMRLLPRTYIVFLRRTFDRLTGSLGDRSFASQPIPIHGEPHSSNCISTKAGIRWIDFENVCVGPLEWDLAYLNAEALIAFPEVNVGLLALLRSLISCCVATWCGVQARFPEMRAYGRDHLKRLLHEFPP